MTPQIQSWVMKAKKDFIKNPGRVLELGSLNINGSVKEFFSDAQEYIGIDIQNGEGVDKVLNAHNILVVFKKNSFDTIICCETLEHDINFWVTVSNIHKVLKQGGTLIITTPTFGFPLHRYPKDYYRFGEDAYKDLFFKGFKTLRFDFVKDIENSPGICCIGQKI